MGPMIINNEIANISDPYTFWCDKNLNNKKLITSIIIAYNHRPNSLCSDAYIHTLSQIVLMKFINVTYHHTAIKKPFPYCY